MPSGLSTLGQEIFHALQTYGAFDVDVAGGITKIRVQLNTYPSSVLNAASTDVGRLIPLLQQVNGAPSSTSGGNLSSWTLGQVPFRGGSSWNTPLTGGGSSDTTAPSTPTNLFASAISSSQISLSWTASTDNVGVTGYQVFRNGTQVGTPSGTAYSDTGLSPSTSYSYTVKATDAAGNVSGNSNTASATTQAGNPVPMATLSANPASITSGQSSTLTWSSTNATSCTGTGFTTSGTSGSVSVSPTVTVTYSVTCNGAGGTSSPASATVTVTGGGGGGTITIGETSVLSTNDSGNRNLLLVQNATLSQTATIQSLSFYVRTAAGNLRLGIYDATGPSGGPGHLIAQTNSFTPTTGWNTQPVTSQVLLPAGNYWLAYFPSSSSLQFAVSTNNVGNYKYANLTFGAMPATFPSINGQGTAHWSLYATLNTASSVDTTPPSIPSNLSATAVSSSAINLSWTASTDNVGVTGYKVYRGGVQVGTSATNSYSDTGLSASTAYTYTVSAYDAAGNNSAQSSSASATTQPPPPPPPTVFLSANPQSIGSGDSSNSHMDIHWRLFLHRYRI